MTNSIPAQATHTNTHQVAVSLKTKAGSPKPDIFKSKKRKTNNVAKPAFDMYQEVTNQMIEALENGVKPWVCPWNTSGGCGGLPVNYQSKKAYSGINILLLWSAAMKLNFTSNYWLTFKQALDVGANVRKGEKGTRIVFYKMLEVKDRNTGENEKIPMLKSFVVFNANQIDGLDIEAEIKSDDVTPFEAIEHVETFINATGAKITEQGEKAYFRPSTDEIVLPSRDRFENNLDFYCTALHELTHWTGAKHRLDRIKNSRFGSEEYAFEELIAELGASFLMAGLNISGEVQHESYIASWLNKLKNDKRYIFKAASAASKAHQYLMESTTEQQKAA